MALYYCKKCGRIAHEVFSEKRQICDCCKSIMFTVPQKYLDDELDFMIKNDLSEDILREELVKTSPEFDQYLFDHRDEILSKQSAELDAKRAIGKAILEEQNRTVNCSYCGSSNVKKIGLFNRAMSIELWGLASKKIGKQFHCNNCGADF